MNHQTEHGIEWTHIFGPGSGYTWNPVGGCKHGCAWQMPDNSTAFCYAKTFADRARSPQFYPAGFAAHYWHPKRLTEPLKLKSSAGIFLDSMSDLMGHWVPAEQIEQVLDVCRKTPQHVYFLLTKNAPRLRQFTFPSNVWVGVSAPPSAFMGKPLLAAQQRQMVLTALNILSEIDVPIRWMSVEPLSFDIAPLLVNSPLQWAVIGAATTGQKVYQPKPEWVERLLYVLDQQNIPIFFKGNLHGNRAADPFREEFPHNPFAPLPHTDQLALFGDQP